MMEKRISSAVFIALCLASVSLSLRAQTSSAPAQIPLPPPENRSDLSVIEIVDRANKALRGDTSHGRLTMTVVTPSWTRKLDIEGWNKGRKLAYIVIHSPPKEKGTVTLRRGDQMWMWMPHVERLLKVPPTMMHSSWQGSDFTYEDLVKADSIVVDYTHRLIEKKNGEEFDLYKIESVPRPEAPVVWGKILFWARVYADGQVAAEREEDYNERGDLMRVVSLSEFEVFDGRRIPTRLECVAPKKPGRKTTLKYHDLRFDVELADSFFSVGRMQK